MNTENIVWEAFIPAKKRSNDDMFISITDNGSFVFNKYLSSVLISNNIDAIDFFIDKKRNLVSFKKGSEYLLCQDRGRLRFARSKLCEELLQHYNVKKFYIIKEGEYYILHSIKE